MVVVASDRERGLGVLDWAGCGSFHMPTSEIELEYRLDGQRRGGHPIQCQVQLLDRQHMHTPAIFFFGSFLVFFPRALREKTTVNVDTGGSCVTDRSKTEWNPFATVAGTRYLRSATGAQSRRAMGAPQLYSGNRPLSRSSASLARNSFIALGVVPPVGTVLPKSTDWQGAIQPSESCCRYQATHLAVDYPV
jgi:hypothetical protein